MLAGAASEGGGGAAGGYRLDLRLTGALESKRPRRWRDGLFVVHRVWR